MNNKISIENGQDTLKTKEYIRGEGAPNERGESHGHENIHLGSHPQAGSGSSILLVSHHDNTIVDAKVAGHRGTITIMNNELHFTPGDDFADLLPGESRDIAIHYELENQKSGEQLSATTHLRITGSNGEPTIDVISTGNFLDVGDETHTNFSADDANSMRTLPLSEETATPEESSIENKTIAAEDVVTTAEDTAINIDVLANDSDVSGSASDLTLLSVSPPSHGRAMMNTDGTVRYVPHSEYSGSDSFTYTMIDSAGEIHIGTISVEVAPVADAPNLIASKIIYDVNAFLEPGQTVSDLLQNGSLVVPLNIDSKLTDNDGSERLTLTISGLSSGAMLSAGTDNGDGSWTVAAPDIEGLSLLVPPTFSGDMPLQVTAVATEDANHATATESVTLDLSINTDAVELTPATSNARIYASGTQGDDVMHGANGADRLNGADGDDRLYGYGGNDRLIGGNGDDHLFGHAGRDNLNGGAGDDHLYGHSGNDYLHAGSGDDVLFGGSGRDRLYSGAGDDYLDGGTGNDFLFSQGGNNLLYGGEGSDRIYAYYDGENTLYGGEGNDMMIGYFGNNTLYGGEGSDTMYTVYGSNTLHGGEGNDRVYAYYGDQNTLYGEGGDDILYTYQGDNTLDGGEGHDTLYAYYGGENTLRGGEGNDTLYAHYGNNTLEGGAGDDRLTGGRHNDMLIGGEGDDTALGGQGDDIYRFQSGDGSDTFHGGSGSWTDLIQLDHIGMGPNEAGGDWTLAITNGVDYTLDTANQALVFDTSASGDIVLSSGDTLSFTEIEKISWGN